MYGFDSVKDLVEVLLIPAVGGTIALLWPELQAQDKRRRFERLIVRELEELGPHPKTRADSLNSWTDHQKKNFVHKKLLEDTKDNRDFILSIDPELVYLVTQLWDAHRAADAKQWLWYLECLAKRYGSKIEQVRAGWQTLIESYENETYQEITMEESAEKYLLQEFEGLREEIMECIKESRSLERNALLASGAIWAWAIANKTQAVYQPLLLVPPLIAILSALRAWSLWKHLSHLSKYLKTVEEVLSLPDGLGWERVFSASTDYSKSISAIVFWVLLVAATIIAALCYG